MNAKIRTSLMLATTLSLLGVAHAQDAGNEQGFDSSIAYDQYLGEADIRASQLIGMSVRNRAGEEIGEVQDLMIGDDDEVATAVLSVGGFLGIGEKLVAIRYDELRISEAGDTLYLATTRPDLEARPGFEWPEERRNAAPASADVQTAPSQSQVAAPGPEEDQVTTARAEREAFAGNDTGRTALASERERVDSAATDGDRQSQAQAQNDRAARQANGDATPEQQTPAEAAAVTGDPAVTAERLEAERTTPLDEEDAQGPDNSASARNADASDDVSARETDVSARNADTVSAHDPDASARDQNVTAAEQPRTVKTMSNDQRRASQVIGAAVVDDQGQEVGSLDDLVVSTRAGKVGEIEAVLSIGGVLGIGNRLVAVPLTDIELTSGSGDAQDEMRIEIAMSSGELSEQPDFRYEAED